jgi:hypothetical protein
MEMSERLTKEGFPVAKRAELQALSGSLSLAKATQTRKPSIFGRTVDEDDATPKTPVGGGTGYRHS